MTITLTLTLAPIPYTPGTGTLRALGTLLARSGHAPPAGHTLRLWCYAPGKLWARSGHALPTRSGHGHAPGMLQARTGTLWARSVHAQVTLWARFGHAPGTLRARARFSGHDPGTL
jgi:hypothetical protein